MNVIQAIEAAIEHFRESGNLTPSHCDVRCLINDLTADNQRIYRRGYDQDRAFRIVRNRLTR